MRHHYRCPMRWADLDLLGHVNNVVYVDYLQEARVDMLRVHADLSDPSRAPGAPAEGIVVVNHEIDYLRPLLLSAEPMQISCWVSAIRGASFTVAYELSQPDLPGGADRVCARATTTLAPFVFGSHRPRRISAGERVGLARFLEEPPPRRPLARCTPGEAKTREVFVRFSDIDVYGHVNNVRYLEYFQEGRIAVAGELWGDTQPHLVVGRTEVDYLRPLLLRPAPYLVRTWVSGVGATSFVLEAEITDAAETFARSRTLMVQIGAEGSAAPLADQVRQRLELSRAS